MTWTAQKKKKRTEQNKTKQDKKSLPLWHQIRLGPCYTSGRPMRSSWQTAFTRPTLLLQQFVEKTMECKNFLSCLLFSAYFSKVNFAFLEDKNFVKKYL